MKKNIFLSITLSLAVFLTSCMSKPVVSTNKRISLVDDLGTKIELKEPAKKIISLYSGHTENLFSLGLNEEIIGVGRAEAYPKEVLSKKAYDYKGDPEEIIKEKPDVVIMRTTITKTYPDYVKTLQNAGIQVVSLFPETFNDFDNYIERLGIITGKEKEAKAKLEEFHKELNRLKSNAEKIANKKKVFLETMGNDLKTASKDSFPWNALSFAGAINIAEGAADDKSSGTIANFGAERLLAKSEEIEIYIAQKGGNNPSVTEEVIKKRPGFGKIKAIKDNKILIVDEKLVSSPAFRFIQGVTEIQKYLYPEMQK